SRGTIPQAVHPGSGALVSCLFPSLEKTMAECVNCGTKLEEGTTVCVSCGARLSNPGSFLQACGWVTVCVSSIPLVVGVIAAQQKNFVVLGIGIAVLLSGIVLIAVGKAKVAAAPATTRPSPSPAGAPPAAGA